MFAAAVFLNPTPPERLVDAAGRPYFFWDSEMTLDRLRELLASGDEPTRAWLAGKLMRQARPDDVFEFIGLAEIVALLPLLVRHLGRTRAFWTWWLERWGALPHG